MAVENSIKLVIDSDTRLLV